MHKETDNAAATGGTKVHEASSAAMDSVVKGREELAIKAVNASSGRDVEIVIFDPDQKKILKRGKNLSHLKSFTKI